MQLTVQGLSQNWETAPKTVTAVSIKKSLICLPPGLTWRPFPVYSVQVPRTDENGRQLKALLDYLLDGEIDAKDIYDALGTSSSTYYRRIKEPDYPNAEELRRVADRFDLSYPDLQIQFGLMTRQEVFSYVESARAVDRRGLRRVVRHEHRPLVQHDDRGAVVEGSGGGVAGRDRAVGPAGKTAIEISAIDR